MKQEIISYLSTCTEDLKELNKYIYYNPEPSYKEIKCSKYIVDLFRKYNFTVEENFLNINTAFCAKIGNGHPKVCYICEYDAIHGEGHITGHNLLSTMSFGAAIGLAKVIDKIGGSIVVLGCPGEYLGGAKITMFKQGVFNDVDVVLMAHPDVITSESGVSKAILPISVKYSSSENGGLSFLNSNPYSPLDATLLSFNILNTLVKGFNDTVTVDSVLSQGGYTPLLIPKECESKFYIRSNNMCDAKTIESKLKNIANCVSSLMDLNYSFSLYELPYDDLLTNRTLSRLFSHNLKEHGIINIGDPRNINAGLSIGTVSHCIPCIHPYISIVETNNISYGTKDFGEATLTDYALSIALKVSECLACTAVDIIQKQTLLNEARNELKQK